VPDDLKSKVIERGTVNKIVSQVVLGEDDDPEWQSSRLPAPGISYPKLKLPRSNTSVIQDQIGHRKVVYKTMTQCSLEGNAKIKPGEPPCRNAWNRNKSTLVLGQMEEEPQTRYETAYSGVHRNLIDEPHSPDKPAKGRMNYPLRDRDELSPREMMRNKGMLAVGSNPNDTPATRDFFKEKDYVSPTSVYQASGIRVRGSVDKTRSTVALKQMSDDARRDCPWQSTYCAETHPHLSRVRAPEHRGRGTTTHSEVVLGTDGGAHHYTSEMRMKYAGRRDLTNTCPGTRHAYQGTQSNVRLNATGYEPMTRSYPPPFATPAYVPQEKGSKPELQSTAFFWSEGKDERRFDTQYTAIHTRQSMPSRNQLPLRNQSRVPFRWAPHEVISREDILDRGASDIHPGVRAGREVCLEASRANIAAIAAAG